jgi:hypothetical protein
MKASSGLGWFRCALALALALCAFAPARAATTSTDTVQVFASAPTAYELGVSPGAFTFIRSGITGALTVNYTVGGTATAGTQYVGLSGSVVIPDGATSAMVLVTPIEEAIVEGATTVDVTITPNAAYIVGTAFVAEVLIADDDLTASIEVPQVVCYEPLSGFDEAGGGVFRVQLTAPFSATALGRITVDFAGGATFNTDYNLYYLLGQDAGFSVGTMKESGRLPQNNTSNILRGWGTNIDVLDSNGTIVGTKGDHLVLSSGITSTSTPGIFRGGDVIEIGGLRYLVSSSPAPALVGGAYQVVVVPLDNNPLPTQFAVPTAVITAIQLTGNRVQFTGLRGYDHIEFLVAPKSDDLAEGAESVTCALEGSPDFTIVDPTQGTLYIADTTPIMSIALGRNAVEGGTTGLATVSSTLPFPFPITIPYVVTGTANYATDKPNVGAPADYTIPGLDTTTGVGLITLPAGQTSVQVPITALADALTETVETVTISLIPSLDYSLAGSSNSSLNPSVTVNIADSTVPIVISPTTVGTGTSTTTGAGTTGTGTGTVRPLPTNSGSNSCGLGSGLGIIGLSLAMLARVGRRRRG